MADHTDVLVAIVGAGPGGLLLASYLQKHLAPALIPHVKVFESESSRDVRSQGGSLDLHADSGLYAIKSVGLYAKFQEKVRDGGEGMRVVDAVSGEVLLMDEGGGGEGGGVGDRPEIDRTDLKDILFDSLLPDTISWGHYLASAVPTPSGKSWTLSFRLSDSSTKSITTQILIGADGAWSKVRPLLTPVRPLYSGLSFLDMQISASTLAKNPELAEYVGQGIAFILSGQNRGIIPQRNSSGIIRIYGGLMVPEQWLDEHPLEDGTTERKVQILSWFEGFAPKVLALLDAADHESIVPRKIYAMPPELTWSRPPVPSAGTGGIVALLGDSAHVMSPFAGEGVNLALRDAVELGKTLTAILTRSVCLPPTPAPVAPKLSNETLRYLNEGIGAYESLMFRRSKQAAVESAQNLNICFHPDSPRPFLELMKNMLPPPGGLSIQKVRWFGRFIWAEGWKWAEREGWW